MNASDLTDFCGEYDDSEADTNLDSDNEDQLSVVGERAPVLKKLEVKINDTLVRLDVTYTYYSVGSIEKV